MVWPRFQKFGSIAIGAAGGAAVYMYKKLNDKSSEVHASWTISSEIPISECAKWNFNWDCRDPKSIVKPMKSSANSTIEEQNQYNERLEKHLPKATRHIFLIRHGEYLDNGEDDVNHKLTPRGRQQAKYTGERLRDLEINWDRVIASTMTRAQETCKIILNEIKYDEKNVENCPLIREGAPIPPQPPVGHWKPEIMQFFRDGARIEAGFRRYFHRADAKQEKDSYTLIVGHGNVIRYFICRALQFPPEAWLRISVNHASITHLSISPTGRVTIKTMGDSGHIPVHQVTHKIPRVSYHGV